MSNSKSDSLISIRDPILYSLVICLTIFWLRTFWHHPHILSSEAISTTQSCQSHHNSYLCEHNIYRVCYLAMERSFSLEESWLKSLSPKNLFTFGDKPSGLSSFSAWIMHWPSSSVVGSLQHSAICLDRISCWEHM